LAEHHARRTEFGNLGCRGTGGCIHLRVSTGSAQRTANQVEADYTTSHVLISEMARESVPITIFFDPQVTGSSRPRCLQSQSPRLGDGRPQCQWRRRRDQAAVRQ
jgi:hypothetical protein